MMRSGLIPEAHTYGARADLPIPLYLFVIGGALVVVLSFVLVLRRGGAIHLSTPFDIERFEVERNVFPNAFYWYFTVFSLYLIAQPQVEAGQ
ncbi:MAG: hypothetical protein JWO12_2576 [Frankiales bacterium]|nr:hypothetical protein [Frankiales bacterium]